ncbi:hypothetical protein Hanom_Chr04g00336591 [Helianthus anomalus]
MVMLMVLMNYALYIAEVLYMARDINGTLIMKPVLEFGILQELHEQWMVDVHNWYYEPFLFFIFMSHHHCHAPSWYLHLIRVCMYVCVYIFGE